MAITKEYLKSLDKEGESFQEDMKKLVLKGEITEIDDVIGFKLAENKARADWSSDEVQLRAILPLYDEILIVVTKEISSKEQFEKRFQFTPEEIAFLAEKGRIIPTFNSSYQSYNPELLEPLLQPGIPHISAYELYQLLFLGTSKPEYLLPPLIDKKNISGFADVDARPLCFKYLLASGFGEPIRDMLQQIRKGLLPLEPMCVTCFSMYSLKFLNCAKMRAVPVADAPWCSKLQSFITEMASRECVFSEAFLGSASNLNDIIRGLKVSYSPEISLEDYTEIIDGKVTRAIRQNVNHLLKDPLSKKHKQRLFSRIFELNREVEEISKSKLTSLGVATTDLICYNLKKRVPSETMKKGIGWLANVSLSLQAKLLRKDWAVLQLYKTRKRLGKSKRSKSPN